MKWLLVPGGVECDTRTQPPHPWHEMVDPKTKGEHGNIIASYQGEQLPVCGPWGNGPSTFTNLLRPFLEKLTSSSESETTTSRQSPSFPLDVAAACNSASRICSHFNASCNFNLSSACFAKTSAAKADLLVSVMSEA